MRKTKKVHHVEMRVKVNCHVSVPGDNLQRPSGLKGKNKYSGHYPGQQKRVTDTDSGGLDYTVNKTTKTGTRNG